MHACMTYIIEHKKSDCTLYYGMEVVYMSSKIFFLIYYTVFFMCLSIFYTFINYSNVINNWVVWCAFWGKRCNLYP